MNAEASGANGRAIVRVIDRMHQKSPAIMRIANGARMPTTMIARIKRSARPPPKYHQGTSSEGAWQTLVSSTSSSAVARLGTEDVGSENKLPKLKILLPPLREMGASAGDVAAKEHSGCKKFRRKQRMHINAPINSP